MEQNTIIWIWLTVAITVFVGSCSGLGYLAGRLARRRMWRWRSCVLMSMAIGCLWPALAVGDAWYAAAFSQPIDTADGGIEQIYVLHYVIWFGVPLLFGLTFSLALLGAFLAWRRNQIGRTETTGAA